MLTLKKIAGGAVIASTALLAALSAQAAIPIQHWTLANGAKVYLAATDALPIVDVDLHVDAGSRRDPAAQAGLASASAGMVEKGVRASDVGPALDENALGEAWADLGASFNAGAGAERTSFSLRSLSDPALLDRAVALAAREIGEPSFPADVWQREREQINAALKEADTKPGTVSARAFSQAVYGTHPYGQETTDAALVNGYVYDAPPVGALDRTVTVEGYALTYNPTLGHVGLLRAHDVAPDPALAEPAPLTQAGRGRPADPEWFGAAPQAARPGQGLAL